MGNSAVRLQTGELLAGCVVLCVALAAGCGSESAGGSNPTGPTGGTATGLGGAGQSAAAGSGGEVHGGNASGGATGGAPTSGGTGGTDNSGGNGGVGGTEGSGGSESSGGTTGGTSASGGSSPNAGAGGSSTSAGSGGAAAGAGGATATTGGSSSQAGAGGTAIAGAGGATQSSSTLEQLQQQHVDLRFGMFLHFGIRTFTGGEWAEANQDISQFNPTDFDATQWAEAAASANMQFGILTTKHHDGFALWDSAVSDYDVANTPWRNGQGDVVREYVDAFRNLGLEPGLYYSIWDTTRGVGEGPIVRQDIDFIKAQLSELLTDYGPIALLMFDGWSWSMGHQAASYDEIREHVKSLQPNTLLVDLTHLQDLWDTDIVFFEEPKEVWAPPNNTIPGQQGTTIVWANGWFWNEDVPWASLLSASEMVDDHLLYLEPRWVNFILNCPPNPAGRLDDNIVQRLAEVGARWSPDLSRPPLPAQPPQNDLPVTPVGATASSGSAEAAVDGINDSEYYTVWESDPGLPQSITLDLGQVEPDIGILLYVPKYEVVATPVSDGSISSYSILTSVDGANFTEVAAGTWPADPSMKVATFEPVAARYVRLEAHEALGNYAAATEISVGRRP
jgi:alpha-L-fucosidase